MLTSSALFGCGSEAPVEPRAIHAHYPSLCPLASDSSGSRALELRALGDFDPGNTTVAFVAEDDEDRVLAIPDRTQAVELRTVGPNPHWGVAMIAEDEATEVALWPALRGCEVFASDTADTSPAEGIALAASDRWLLAIGVADRTGQARAAHLLDLGLGSEVDLANSNMARARSFASLTALDTGLLAVGGEDLEQGIVHDDAEFFDPSALRFQGSTSVIALRRARSRHSALNLDGTSVVLIGGADANGQSVRTLERVSLLEDQSADLAELGAGRIDPVALRLSDRRIVVAGGYAVGSNAEAVPIGIVEWFNADATRQVGTLNVEDAALGRAFVAMTAGALLAVGGCDANQEPSPAVWWIGADQQASRLPDLPQAALSCNPQLSSASLGAPFLFSNERLWRFDPWSGEFVLSEIEVPPGAAEPSHAMSVDPGLMTWVDGSEDRARIFVLRHDTRNLYSADVTPFLVSDGTRLAPDLSHTDDVIYVAGEPLEFSGNATVWITDTQYRDFDLELRTAGDNDNAPLILVGSSPVGGSQCPWPATPNSGVLRVQRRGSQVTLIGTRERICSIDEDARVPVGLRAAGESVRLSQISINRGAP